MKRGFSLIALAVIIIIILVLSTSVVIAANSTINNSKKLAFGTEIKLVQDSVSAYRAKNDGNFPVEQSIVFDYSSLKKDSSKIQFTKNNEKIENEKYIVLYEIDYSKCGLESLKYGNGKDGSNDIYAVSLETGIVYYIKGLTIGNKEYYTLTDEIKNLMNMGWEQDSNSGIIFEPTTTSWTKDAVGISIKIPKQYVVKKITTSTNEAFRKNDSLSNMDTMYDIYVKDPSTTVITYDVNITYAEGEGYIDKSVSYHVGNIDITPPKVNTVDVSHTTNSITISVDSDDSDSGIDKYFFSKDGSNYYETKENKFVFENLIEGVTYSDMYIKVVDNVGNVTVKRVADMTDVGNLKTDTLGTININGDFSSKEASTLIEITYSQVADTERFYKIDDDEWNKVGGLTERLYIEEDCTIYAKIVDKSGQVKEVSKNIQRKEK